MSDVLGRARAVERRLARQDVALAAAERELTRLRAEREELVAALSDTTAEYDAWLQWATQVGEVQKRDREKAERKIARNRARLAKLGEGPK